MGPGPNYFIKEQTPILKDLIIPISKMPGTEPMKGPCLNFKFYIIENKYAVHPEKRGVHTITRR